VTRRVMYCPSAISSFTSCTFTQSYICQQADYGIRVPLTLLEQVGYSPVTAGLKHVVRTTTWMGWPLSPTAFMTLSTRSPWLRLITVCPHVKHRQCSQASVAAPCV
jgi:hypothetical protein